MVGQLDELRGELAFAAAGSDDAAAGALRGAGRSHTVDWTDMDKRIMALMAAAALAAACSPRAPEAAADAEADTIRTIVDSIHSIEEELRRFRSTLEGEPPAALSGGAPSRDALVERFISALEAADTAAFRDLLLTRAEFAWLYYPHTRFTAPPYELAPALLWFQMENGTSRGFHRMMQRMAGRPAYAQGYSCPDRPVEEGPNRTWERCVVLLRPPGGEPLDFRLFGSILEHGGVFKFVSYTNGF